MNRALLDTDIFSDILKGKDPAVAARAREYRGVFPHHTISILTVIEIVKGLHKIAREDRIQRFLESVPTLEVLTLDVDAAEVAGRIYADLEKTGQPVGRADPMIAAIALRNGLTLVTANFSHYERIQALGYGLQLENWRRS